MICGIIPSFILYALACLVAKKIMYKLNRFDKNITVTDKGF